MRPAGPLAAAILAAAATSGCIFGGDGGGGPSGPGSVPTATLPPTLSEPIDLDEIAPLPEPAPGDAVATYLVQSGDTMGSIAQQLGVPQDQQAEWVLEVLRLNEIPDARLLQEGQELQLPGSGEPVATPTPQQGGSDGEPNTSSEESYTVVQGDYPLLIAQKLGVPAGDQPGWAQELIALNGISASGLTIGQVLQLPPSTP